MKRLQRLLGALAMVPATGFAQDIDFGSIDAFVVPQAAFAARWPASAALDETGTGFGVRATSRATDTLMVLAEGTRLSLDATDVTRLRVGAGLAAPSTSGIFLTLDRLGLAHDDATALGLHLRLAGRPHEHLGLYAEAGYAGADGDRFYYDGFEFTAGATVDFRMPWGVFVDYRALLLEDRDNDDRLDLRQLRMGLRYRFDC